MKVVRSIDVAVDSDTAFRLFTEEIGNWYRSGRWSWNDPERAKTILIEPGVGGRWLEVWDETTGEGYELGRVRVWEPGERVVLSYRNVHMPPSDTEVEVRFERAGHGDAGHARASRDRRDVRRPAGERVGELHGVVPRVR